jgi:ABC-type nitrate/sulfonate/bicarbonate transport system permease component
MQRATERLVGLLPGFALIAALIALLEVAAQSGWVNKIFVPPPSAIAIQVWDIVTTGAMAQPLTETVTVLFAGYGIGCAAAIVTGILMGYYRPVFLLLEPITEMLRPIPKTALVPLLMLLLGLGASMKITSVALSTFFPVLINTLQGVRAVDPVMSDMARTFGHKGAPLLWRIFLPAAAPYILTGMRISLAIALIVVVIAEMLSSSGGLGALILDMQRTFLVTKSYAWLVIVAVLGFGLNAVFVWAERRATFWSTPSAE